MVDMIKNLTFDRKMWPKIIFPQRVELATFFGETRHTTLPPDEEMVLPLKSLRSHQNLAKML